MSINEKFGIKNKEGDDDIDLDDPWWVLARRFMLEHAAKSEESDLYCPRCETNLPYNQITADYTRKEWNEDYKLTYLCPLCQEYFDKKEK